MPRQKPVACILIDARPVTIDFTFASGISLLNLTPSLLLAYVIMHIKGCEGTGRGVPKHGSTHTGQRGECAPGRLLNIQVLLDTVITDMHMPAGNG
jgi:hypothetical protein